MKAASDEDLPVSWWEGVAMTAPWPMTPAQQVALAGMCDQRLCDNIRDAGRCLVEVPDDRKFVDDKVVSWHWQRLVAVDPLNLTPELQTCRQQDATMVTVTVERQVWV